jgi:hypothetical protein
MPNASLKVVFGLAIRNRFWLGMTISVSTCCCSSSMPASAGAAAAIALEAERLGDDADGQDAAVARRLGDDRRGAGAGAAAHAGGDEAHVGAVERRLDLGDRLLGGGLADLRPRAGAEALRDLQAELDLAVRQAWFSACASVLATMKSTPCTSDCDHVGDGVAARAADADDADPWAELLHFRPDEIDAHAQSPQIRGAIRRACSKPFCPKRFLGSIKKLTLTQSFPQISSILSPKSRNQAPEPAARAPSLGSRDREIAAQVAFVGRGE